MTDANDRSHEPFGILLEKRIQGAESPDEAAQFDQHMLACGECRYELQASRQHEQILHQETAQLVDAFNWDDAKRAIDNRAAREKAIGPWPKIFALLVVLGFFWPIYAAAGGLAYSVIALVLFATFAFWEYSSRAQTRDLLSDAMCGEEELFEAFSDHERSTAKERLGERFGALAAAVIVLGFAANEVMNGGWVGIAVAILFVDVAWILARQVLSAKHRRRDNALDSGKISWADYLIWSVREGGDKSPQTAASITRNLWLARVRLIAVHALLVFMAVDRGGVWIAAVAIVVVFQIRMFRTKSRLKQLGKGE